MIVLSAPIEYQELTPEQKKEICNGCGAKGGIPVPNTMYGLDLSEPCQIHDFRYYDGETWKDKIFADTEFESNIDIIIEWAFTQTEIEYKDSWYMIREPRIAFAKSVRLLRKQRAKKYVYAVRTWGDEAYRFGKGLKPR